jgi:hypothetical protein
MGENKMTNTGKNNTGNRNSGDWNSGSCNSGDWNSGSCNSGDWNSGSCNSGDCNSGSWNSGSCNSGDCNSGSCNSGDWNSGSCNSGYRNSGSWNSGDWNACNHETGAFNTIQSDTIRVFNKDCNREEWEKSDKPDFIYFDLCIWVDESDMTDKEKTADPKFHVRGGYLKTLDYKEAWQLAYEKATPKDIEKLKALPNFDADVFYEISGIRIDAEQTCAGKVVEIDGKKYRLEEV